MGQDNKLHVHVEPAIVAQFKAAAKEIFPREAFGFLLGKRYKSGKRRIDQLWLPKDLARYAREATVLIPEKWLHQVARHCTKNNLEVVGDIHSHPYRYKEYRKFLKVHKNKDEALWPSTIDWLRCVGSNDLTAIMLVYEGRNGRLYTRLGMWGPLPKIKTNVSIL